MSTASFQTLTVLSMGGKPRVFRDAVMVDFDYWYDENTLFEEQDGCFDINGYIKKNMPARGTPIMDFDKGKIHSLIAYRDKSFELLMPRGNDLMVHSPRQFILPFKDLKFFDKDSITEELSKMKIKVGNIPLLALIDDAHVRRNFYDGSIEIFISEEYKKYKVVRSIVLFSKEQKTNTHRDANAQLYRPYVPSNKKRKERIETAALCMKDLNGFDQGIVQSILKFL